MRRCLLGFLAAAIGLPLTSLSCETAEAAETRFGHVVVNGHPEFHVDGEPFFPYVAGFSYHRIPADLWEPALIKLRDMGFNTIDLYVIWNWHEPVEGEIDLVGRTNPRRNLRRVYEIAEALGLKVIVRPGPYIFYEWRNGGYPGWLMRKDGFAISDAAITEGWFPVASSVQYFDQERAAELWLDNSEHWRYTDRWLAAFWELTAPFSAARGGPVIAIQVDDDLAVIYENYYGEAFWRYLDRFGKTFRELGVDVPAFINAAFTRIPGRISEPPLGDPMWVWGQWYLRSGASTIERADVAGLEWTVETLKTQAHVTPMIIEFNTNQYAGPLQTHGQRIAPAADTLLASRVMYQNGLKGTTIFPAIDTLYPAGWEFPPANYYYTWESPLNIALEEDPARGRVIRRDGRLIRGVGSLLAATHEATNVGFLYTLGSLPNGQLDRADLMSFAKRLLAIQETADHAHFGSRYIDLEVAPEHELEQLEMLVLPFVGFKGVDTGQPLTASDVFRERLQRFVERGGSLLIVTDRINGGALDSYFPGLAPPRDCPTVGVPRVRMVDSGLSFEVPGCVAFDVSGLSGVTPIARLEGSDLLVGYEESRGAGQVTVLGFDAFSAVGHGVVPTIGSLERAKGEDAARAVTGVKLFARLAGRAGIEPIVTPNVRPAIALDAPLYSTLLTSNRGKEGAYAFLTISNFSDLPRWTGFQVRDPRSGVEVTIPPVQIDARDSLFLPIGVPLNTLVGDSAGPLSFAPREQIVYSTAELTDARWANHVLELDIYAPGDAQMLLKLDRPPYGNVTATAEASSGDGAQSTDQWPVAASAGEVLPVTYDTKLEQVLIRIPASVSGVRRQTVRIPIDPFHPRILVEAPRSAAPGQTVMISARVMNPRGAKIDGEILLNVPESWAPLRPQALTSEGGAGPGRGEAAVTRSFELSVPQDAIENSTETIRACIRGSHHVCSPPVPIHVRRPVAARVLQAVHFPIRADAELETRPPLIELRAPGQGTVEMVIANNTSSARTVTITAEVPQRLRAEGIPAEVEVAPYGEATASFNLLALENRAGELVPSGTYPIAIHLSSGEFQLQIPVVVVALDKHEAVAYEYDFDRDGAMDVAIENRNLRAILMPAAGGRMFALIDKSTGRNVLNSVGGLRDAFSVDPPKYVWQGIDLRRSQWRWPELRLHNRQAELRILSGTGDRAAIRLSYQAPDVHPEGAIVTKTVSLRGESDFLAIEYEINLPDARDEQSFRAGMSTSLGGGSDTPGALLAFPHDQELLVRPIPSGEGWTPEAMPAGLKWLAFIDAELGHGLALYWMKSMDIVMRPSERSVFLELVSTPLAAGSNRFCLGYGIVGRIDGIRPQAAAVTEELEARNACPRFE